MRLASTPLIIAATTTETEDDDKIMAMTGSDIPRCRSTAARRVNWVPVVPQKNDAASSSM
jgi:hypothetical protein